MNVYLLSANATDAESFHICGSEKQTFDGSSLKTSWESPICKSLNTGTRFYDCMSTDFYDVFLLKKEVAEVLLNYLKDDVEFLEVQSEEYLLVNVLRVLTKSLNIQESETFSLKSQPDRIKYVYKYVFNKEQLATQDLMIFKIDEISISPIFVTDKFVELIGNYGFTGFSFKHVWSSD